MSRPIPLRRKVFGLRVFGRRVFGSTRFAAIGRRVAPRADLALQRISRGKLSMVGIGGLPFLVLRTVGRRTGELRTSPLLYAKADAGSGVGLGDGAGYIVVGSNWGQTTQPGWAFNLRAQPAAEVDVRGRRQPVTARLLEGAERAAAWKLLLEFWPAYDDYEDRASAREIWVFLLTPTAGERAV